ncbi:hypothetical protein Zmor_019120 [Zophobas morio]|uniref:Polyadenylate-binding protein n=1 Tax=Zophobas morio TaxID=2755281 RepID=A0AA38M1I4_9CUCU|nr:hypothetical protein Zmor_019120 [Zophobas morio]
MEERPTQSYPSAVSDSQTSPHAPDDLNLQTTSASFGPASLYVGDLAPSVTEARLYEIFNAVGPVASIRVCRDLNTRRSLGYAYVNYRNAVDAERALDTMNFTVINGRPCRVMWSQRDPTIRKTGRGNVFVKNLSKNIDNKALADTFSMFGNILSCKVVEFENGSGGFGYVHFETEEASKAAIQNVNGKILDGQKVCVEPFLSKQERGLAEDEPPKFNNLYIKNIPEHITAEGLKKEFEKFGMVGSCVVMTNEEGRSKKFGFVCFEDPEDAKKALKDSAGLEIDGAKVAVSRAQRKRERTAILRQKYEQERNLKVQGNNVYVKNLSESVDDTQLEELFSPYGVITSAKVMKDSKGGSRCFGFVCFSKPEEAASAIVALQGLYKDGKPLYVALAQKKEERLAHLSIQHLQRQGNLRMASPAAVYPVQGVPLLPRPGIIGGPLPYKSPRWGGPMIKPAFQYVSPPGFVGVLSPRPASLNGLVLPAHQSFQQQPLKGSRNQTRASRFGQRSRPSKIPSSKSTESVSNAASPKRIPNGAYEKAPPTPELTLEYLSLHSPTTQKQSIGDRLYPLVSQLSSPGYARQITGMLLDMDNTELLHLLESPEALKEQVDNAYKVLEAHRNREKVI